MRSKSARSSTGHSLGMFDYLETKLRSGVDDGRPWRGNVLLDHLCVLQTKRLRWSGEERLLLWVDVLVDDVQHSRGRRVVAHQGGEVHHACVAEQLYRTRERLRAGFLVAEHLAAERNDHGFLGT